MAQLQRGSEALVTTTVEARQRHDFRPSVTPRPGPRRKVRTGRVVAMRKKMEQREHGARYRLRQQTVEPVLGIVKQAMGFRKLLFRHTDKVQGEWGLGDAGLQLQAYALLGKNVTGTSGQNVGCPIGGLVHFPGQIVLQIQRCRGVAYTARTMCHTKLETETLAFMQRSDNVETWSLKGQNNEN